MIATELKHINCCPSLLLKETLFDLKCHRLAFCCFVFLILCLAKKCEKIFDSKSTIESSGKFTAAFGRFRYCLGGFAANSMTEEQVLLRANGEIQVVLSGTVAIPVNHSQFAERESYETLAYCFGLVVDNRK